MNRRPQMQIVAPNASAEEAAALVAAVEQFMRNHAPVIVADDGPSLSGWQAAALREGVRRAPEPAPFWA